MNILGGVSHDTWLAERDGLRASGSHAATVVRHSDDGRARLRLGERYDFVVGERLLCDDELGTVGLDVYAVHLNGRLIDVHVRATGIAGTRVVLRRSPLS